MAINLFTQYPGKVGPVVSNTWPYGEPRNITTPGDGTGTPWEAALAKDIIGLQQALLQGGGIVPTGTPEQANASQYLQALVELSSGRAEQYNESGVANAYILDPKTNQQSPASYFAGMTVKFTPGNDNSGPSTINVNGLGVKTILNGFTGAALSNFELLAVDDVTLTYDGTNFLTEGLSGKWVPTIEGGTTAGTGWVYTIQIGEWRKAGKIFMQSFNVQVTTIGASADGNVEVHGMPNVNGNFMFASNTSGLFVNIFTSNAIANTGGRTNFLMNGIDSNSRINIVEDGNGLVSRNFTIADLPPTFNIVGTYIAMLK